MSHFATRFKRAAASKSRRPLSRSSAAACCARRRSNACSCLRAASMGSGLFTSFLRRFVAASTLCAARAADSPVSGGVRRVQHQTDFF